ncbi:MAG: hypothetical protein LH478_08685 [Chitinophagaceae bacterium]|nr:hypothetical protein [Chitinophagaceae bacterium]
MIYKQVKIGNSKMLRGGMIEKVKVKRKKNHTTYLQGANYLLAINKLMIVSIYIYDHRMSGFVAKQSTLGKRGLRWLVAPCLFSTL